MAMDELFSDELFDGCEGIGAVMQPVVVAERSIDRVIPHGKIDSFDPDQWFSVCVLTVPDVDRFPVPVVFSENKVAIDLSGLDELSWGDVRRLVTASVPDEQLDEIEAREKGREKPRAKVLEAVAAERVLRGDGFGEWVRSTGGNPLTCRIAAIAWQAGGAAEVVPVAPADLSQELVALRDCFAAWTAFCSDSGFDRLAGWDLDYTMRVICARRAAMVEANGLSDFRPCLPVSGRDWISLVAQSGGLSQGAASLGIAQCEIPEIASPMEVWRAYRLQPGDVRLSDWVAGQLMLEREMLMVTQGLW